MDFSSDPFLQIRLQALCVYVVIHDFKANLSKRFAKDEDDEEDLPEAQVAPKFELWGRFERNVSMDVRLPLFFCSS